MATAVNLVHLRRLRVLGVVEGISTLLLFFVAMPLKYMADMPMAVTIVGSIHGFLFIALCLALVLGRDAVPLPNRLVVFGILGAIVPFGPFVVDRHLDRLAEGTTPGARASASAGAADPAPASSEVASAGGERAAVHGE